MAQSGKYGVDIMVDGIPVAERLDGVAAVPFGKDYEIQLRNSDHRRAAAYVFIDGVNVTEGGLVVYGNSKWSLRRPLDKAVTFRVASSSSAAAAAHGKAGEDVDGSKGLVKVEWRAETAPPYIPRYDKNGWSYLGGGSQSMDLIWDGNTYTRRRRNGEKTDTVRLWKLGYAMGESSLCTTKPPELSSVVTVEGDYSDQQFVDVKVGTLERDPTIILIKLMGYDATRGQPVQQGKVSVGVNYCPQCGTFTTSPNDKFCRACGNKF